MSIAGIGDLGEAFGSMLMLVTLVHLAIQNKQQQKLMLSQAYQTRSDLAKALEKEIEQEAAV